MITDPSLSLSNAILLGVTAFVGVILYAGVAYLVTRSKNVDIRHRWRYSIVWGVSFGVLLSILFGMSSILTLLGDENELGYMALFQSQRNPLDLFIGIVLFLAYPILISLPLVFIITLGTYWKEMQRGDMFINRLLYPVKKHFSDQSSDSVFEKLRILFAKFIDR